MAFSGDFSGCYTALVTPFSGREVDEKGLDSLVDFQLANGVSGILAVGTTGESPTLFWEEHNRVIHQVTARTRGRCTCIAGTGSNNTAETVEATTHAAQAGADAVLLVDPYYNGPSSLEIRKEYVAVVAAQFPDVQIIPYIIPGRTGTRMFPEDVALLAQQFENVRSVKEATGDLDNMRRTRELCGGSFAILSGDDDMTATIMADASIAAAGVISVMSNVAPAAVSDMTQAFADGDKARGEGLAAALKPLFSLVNVTTEEESPHGPVTCRSRNPVPVKTMMAVLGMPAGACRQPLGRMTGQGLDKVVTALRTVWRDNPQILTPVADHFGVDIEARLNDPEVQKGLAYTSY